MSETQETPADPLTLVNRVVNVAFPLLGLLGLVGGIAQAVRGEPTAHVASFVVGGITLLGVPSQTFPRLRKINRSGRCHLP